MRHREALTLLQSRLWQAEKDLAAALDRRDELEQGLSAAAMIATP